MRTVLTLLILLGFLPAASAEEKLRLTVTWRTFATTDDAIAKWWSEHLQPSTESANEALATMLKLERAVEHESISTIVRLDKPFECSQVQGLRKFKVAGTIKRHKDETYLLDITPQLSERDPSRVVILPEGPREAIRNRSYGVATVLNPASAFVMAGGISSRTSNDRTEHTVAIIETRIDMVKE